MADGHKVGKRSGFKNSTKHEDHGSESNKWIDAPVLGTPSSLNPAVHWDEVRSTNHWNSKFEAAITAVLSVMKKIWGFQ